ARVERAVDRDLAGAMVDMLLAAGPGIAAHGAAGGRADRIGRSAQGRIDRAVHRAAEAAERAAAAAKELCVRGRGEQCESRSCEKKVLHDMSLSFRRTREGDAFA